MITFHWLVVCVDPSKPLPSPPVMSNAVVSSMYLELREKVSDQKELTKLLLPYMNIVWNDALLPDLTAIATSLLLSSSVSTTVSPSGHVNALGGDAVAADDSAHEV